MGESGFINVNSWTFGCNNNPPAPSFANLCGQARPFYAYVTSGERADRAGSYTPWATAGTGPGVGNSADPTVCGATGSGGGYMTLWGARNCFSDTTITGTDFNSKNGGKYVALDGELGRGKLSQSINLTAGKTYTLSVEYAFAQQFKPCPESRGNCGSTDLYPGGTTLGADVPEHGFSGWKTYTYEFTPTTTKSVPFEFAAYGRLKSGNDNTYGDSPPFLLLDGVSLTEKAGPTSVPAPLPLAGAVPLGVAMRKLSRKRALLLARR